MYKMFMLLIRLPVNRRLLVVEFLGGQNCKWVFSLHGWRGTVNDPNPHFVQKSAVLLGMLGWLSWFLISAQDAISGVWDQVSHQAPHRAGNLPESLSPAFCPSPSMLSFSLKQKKSQLYFYRCHISLNHDFRTSLYILIWRKGWSVSWIASATRNTMMKSKKPEISKGRRYVNAQNLIKERTEELTVHSPCPWEECILSCRHTLNSNIQITHHPIIIYKTTL